MELSFECKTTKKCHITHQWDFEIFPHGLNICHILKTYFLTVKVYSLYLFTATPLHNSTLNGYTTLGTNKCRRQRESFNFWCQKCTIWGMLYTKPAPTIRRWMNRDCLFSSLYTLEKLIPRSLCILKRLSCFRDQLSQSWLCWLAGPKINYYCQIVKQKIFEYMMYLYFLVETTVVWLESRKKLKKIDWKVSKWMFLF